MRIYLIIVNKLLCFYSIITLMIKYKNPKTVDEQIQHLKINKRVVFNDISEDEAKDILIKYNYINVISPFKYIFSEKGKDGIPIKDSEGRHIYSNDVDFNVYYQCYLDERKKYKTIYKNISEFETIFKAVLAYETINYYDIKDSNSFDEFMNTMFSNINTLRYRENELDKIYSSLTKIQEDMDKFNNIYVLFDRFSFNEAWAIFRCVMPKIRQDVFDILNNNNLTYERNSPNQLDELITIMIPIRNYVCHENSLTILERYYNIHSQTLRTKNDRERFHKLIQKLSIEKASS